MKSQKTRSILALALCAVLLSASIQTAAASTPKLPASENDTALALNAIDILKGDGTGFNLNGIPDRVQAAIMVVRMRGEEQMALDAYDAGVIENPFSDVTEDWAEPYVAWLYHKGLTVGVGGGKFGRGTCSAQEYATFMLRALGYTDTGSKTDFTYANAISYAKNKGIYLGSFDGQTFDRGVMASVTYLTLAADVKGESNSLLFSLVDSGAISAADAKNLLKTFGENSLVPTGGTFTVLVQNNEGRSMLGTNSGNTVDRAKYQAAKEFEKNNNVNLITKTAFGSDWEMQVSLNVMAGILEYDLHVGSVIDTFSLAESAVLEDLSGLALDDDKTWWNYSLNENMTVGGKLYAAVGDFLAPDMLAQSAIYYNPKTISEYGYDNLDDLVYEGNWTLEEFARMAADNADINGFSFFGDELFEFKMYNAAEMAFLDRDSSDMLKFSVDRDILSEIIYIISDIDGRSFTVPDNYDIVKNGLKSGRYMFVSDTLAAADKYLYANSGISVVPMPKFAEWQDRYVSAADPFSMQVISTSKSINKTHGALIDALNRSFGNVENAFVSQYGTDNTNKEMLEIILQGNTVDLIVLSDYFDEFARKFSSGTRPASLISAYKKPIESELQKLSNKLS